MKPLLAVAGVACLAGAVLAQVPGAEPIPIPPPVGPVNWPQVVGYALGIAWLYHRQRSGEKKLRLMARRFRRERDEARRQRDAMRARLEEVEARGEAQGRLVDGVVIPMVAEAVKRQSESGLLPALPDPEPHP